MGLERLAAVVQNTKTVFETDLFAPLVATLPAEMSARHQRVVADHARAISFLVADGLLPGNKEAAYVLRRLLRRLLALSAELELSPLLAAIQKEYSPVYPELNQAATAAVLAAERERFERSLKSGLQALRKLKKVDATAAFNLYETYGLPFEVIKDNVPDLSREDFDQEFGRHQQVSRAGVEGSFQGGLANQEPETIRLHTAHHLILAALQQVLGPAVKQRGSNINQERLRIDFSYPEKLTDQQKQAVEQIVNQKIAENWRVVRKEMSRDEAEQIGAEMEFGQKYGEVVSVYFIQNSEGQVFSQEFCGGPHVASTGDIGPIKITKEEATGAGLRRLRAVLV
jgi:alanyl-tRNA synthetase